MRSGYLPLLVDLRTLGVILEAEDSEGLLVTFDVRPLLVDQIQAGQLQDPRMIISRLFLTLFIIGFKCFLCSNHSN